MKIHTYDPTSDKPLFLVQRFAILVRPEECTHSTVRSFFESIHSDYMLTSQQCFAVEITWYVHFKMLAIIFYSRACFSKSRHLQWRLQITQSWTPWLQRLVWLEQWVALMPSASLLFRNSQKTEEEKRDDDNDVAVACTWYCYWSTTVNCVV